jgi:hypothetical protein
MWVVMRWDGRYLCDEGTTWEQAEARRWLEPAAVEAAREVRGAAIRVRR